MPADADPVRARLRRGTNHVSISNRVRRVEADEPDHAGSYPRENFREGFQTLRFALPADFCVDLLLATILNAEISGYPSFPLSGIRLRRRGMAAARQYSGGANGNRSLERGIEILRAFRPGVDTLGNGEIAERTGLPRSTVSRLTKTLVAFGMLDEVRTQRTYRLAAAVLSLGHAVRMGSPVLTVLGPLMRAESTRRRLNVGLATADRAMMVYLESIRYNARPTLRSIVAGQQVPMELTSLGRAYLAGIPDTERDRLMAQFRRRTATATKALIAEVQKSIRCVRRDGYCAVSWQPGVLAVATPIVLDGLPVYAINMSVQDIEPTEAVGAEIGGYLVAFAARCKAAFSSFQNEVEVSA
ncbi:IclR family transcriptional regulator [Bradyrhizobium oligotrophicum]|uniref:IclR family transcriptional regulator n=1 Tax=Bradyrhizobium oligotrophicum TaxID=44255 RepID=UPI00366EE6E4